MLNPVCVAAQPAGPVAGRSARTSRWNAWKKPVLPVQRLLVTACQKCQIHFKCAQNDPLLGEELSIQIRDLTTLIAEQLSERAEQGEMQEVSIGD